MIEIGRLCAFLAFLLLGFHITHRRDPDARRRAINLFLLYTLAISVVIGATQLDAWPFSTYRLANATWKGQADRPLTKIKFFGVDGAGRETEVDPSAWSPLYPVVMQFYFHLVFPTLDASQRAELGRFLLDRADRSRHAIHNGRHYGNARLLGTAAAPDWWLYDRHPNMPASRWTAIRVYRESWIPRVRYRDSTAFTRRLELEYPPR